MTVMNILVIGRFSSEDFALHIDETLGAMGHSVRRFTPGPTSRRIGGRFGQRLDQLASILHSSSDSLPAVRAHRIRSLWRVAAAGPLDLVILCHDLLWPAEVSDLKRRTGAAVALWFPDHLGSIGRGFFMTADYDALFFKDPYLVHRLAPVLNCPVYYLPECFNPAKHCLEDPQIDNDPLYQCDLTTAGNLHSYRVAFFEHLARYDVKQWGAHPPLWLPALSLADMHQGRQVLNHEKARAFRGAKIVINNLMYAEIWGVNVRTFEAAGAGAFQLIDWRPGLAQLFEEEKELVAFRDMADLRDKIDYWLPRDEERLVIGEAASRRAHAEHTYRQRLELLLRTVAGEAKGFSLPDIRYLSST